jgi:UPF0755 protein
MTTKSKKKTKKNKKSLSFKTKILSFFLILFIIISCSLGYLFYFYKNVNIKENKKYYFYVHTGAKYQNVLDSLQAKHLLKDIYSFRLLAKLKKYDKNIKPGRYLLKSNMTNNQLINMLRSGKQEYVKVILYNIRKKEDLVSKVVRYIEADSTELLSLLSNKQYLQKFNFTPDNVMALFIPNTYFMYWNTSAQQFINKMALEYKLFWNKERLKKANDLALTPIEVSIIASIVQSETLKPDEMTNIAGVYINRLRKNMLLQADPTVVFAIGNFKINRVLKHQLSVDSPYNTYKYKGLPPGPITLSSTETIDKVLEYQHHDYLYFCAKPDFSGYHNFAKTEAEHLLNAKKFQKALDEKNIKH